VLLLLLFAYIFNFIDRNIIGVLAVPIREEFDLSDVRTYPLDGRKSKAKIEDFARPVTPRATFKEWFDAPEYPVSQLDGAWAINAYDALHVVTEAIQQIHTDDKVSRATVEAKIAAIEVSSASGPIAFDDTGNRTDLPTVVELCPPDDETKPPTSVVFNTSKPIDRTQCADN